MEIAPYQKLTAQTSGLKPDAFKAWRVLTWVFTTTSVSIALSFSGNTLMWLVGQILYGLSILQWFVLLHDFGHNYFFKSSRWNCFFGYVSSLFCLVPFAPWKWIHSQHHTWTGWHDLDPTQEATLPGQSSPSKNIIANWSWKLGLPLLTLAFSFKNFWNLPRLFRLFKDTNKRIQFLFSVCLPLLVLGLQIQFIPGFLHAWLFGYFMFLYISDPLLISQHVHIPQKLSNGKPVSPFAVKEQDQFTRSLLFPKWISKYFLLSFDKHSLHHVLPRLACYHLQDIDINLMNSIQWTEWLMKAKRTPAEKLLFSNNNETGLNI